MQCSFAIPTDHPSFAGHFPGQPIVPGVVLLDEAIHLLNVHSGRRVTGLSQAKFLSVVRPGESLELSATVGEADARFDIRCGDRKVVSGRATLEAA